MAKNPNSLANLRPPWKPGESGNPNGKPKNRITEHHAKLKVRPKKGDLNQEEINDIERSLLAMTKEAIRTIASHEDTVMYEKNYAKAILEDEANGRTCTIDRLRERQYGKDAQKVELTGANGAALFPSFTVEIIDSRDQVDNPNNDNSNHDNGTESE